MTYSAIVERTASCIVRPHLTGEASGNWDCVGAGGEIVVHVRKGEVVSVHTMKAY